MVYLCKRKKVRPKKKDFVNSFMDLIDIYIIKLVLDWNIRQDMCPFLCFHIPNMGHDRRTINEFVIVDTYVSLPY